MLAYAFYEGNSRLQQYAKSLVARGDTVDFFCLAPPGSSSTPEKGITVCGIQGRPDREAGRFSYARNVFLFFLRSAFTLTRKHREQPYDLVHVHSVPDILVFTALIPKLSGTPVILDIHDILPEFYAAKFGTRKNSAIFSSLVFLEKISLAFADHVIIANAIWEDRLLSRSVSRDKVTTIENHPNSDLFYCRPRERQDGKFIVTYPGSLNWHQGVDIAVRAFAKIVPVAPEAEFHIYGQGPERPILENLVRELGLEHNVKFNNFVPTKDVVQIMANSDLGIAPKRSKSIFGAEAASTKIMEFMSLGVPVVISRTRIDSLYHSDATVKFYDHDDPDELASAIIQLRDNPQQRAELASNALAYVAGQTWSVKKRKYLALVDRLVTDRKCVVEGAKVDL